MALYEDPPGHAYFPCATAGQSALRYNSATKCKRSGTRDGTRWLCTRFPRRSELGALHAAGVDQVFEERGVPGAQQARQGLQKALGALQRGDVLVVWRLDLSGAPWPI
jgi:hypothetical protein